MKEIDDLVANPALNPEEYTKLVQQGYNVLGAKLCGLPDPFRHSTQTAFVCTRHHGHAGQHANCYASWERTPKDNGPGSKR